MAPDGTRHTIAYGIRMVQKWDGSVERADELLPGSAKARPLKLPERLGGGYLFYVPASEGTPIWRAKTWTSSLAPLAHLDLEVEDIVAGFDRLYVVSERDRELIALDAEHGTALDLGPLPPAPFYESLAFADGFLGAVDVPLRGVLVTFDAGESWHPIGFDEGQSVALEDGEIVVQSEGKRRALDASGVWIERGGVAEGGAFAQKLLEQSPALRWAERDPASIEPEAPSTLATGPLGRSPLETTVLRGFAETRDHALVAHNGVLARVRLRDGKVLDLDERAFSSGSECQAVRLGRGHGFVCGQELGATTVYAFSPPFGLRPVLSFAGPRYVAASGNGALVIRGSCEHASEQVATFTYCLRAVDGTLREIRVRGDAGVERVVALKDGRAVVIVPPRLGADGLLSILDRDGGSSIVKLELPEEDAEKTVSVARGLWLDGFREGPDGTLAGWVAESDRFAGVRVKLDGSVEFGIPESGLERVVLAGRYALLRGAGGDARQSVDGGFTWQKLELPKDADGVPSSERATAGLGCSELGCVLGSVIRVGWNAGDEASALKFAQTPKPTAIEGPGGSRWRITCHPSGERSRAALSPSTEAEAGAASEMEDELSTAGWQPFWEAPPPPLAHKEVGFGQAADSDPFELRGYVWGPPGVSWGRAGSWRLIVLDKFEIDGIWSTLVTRSPWEDRVTAAQAFGHDAGGSTSTWRVELEPSGRSGILLISSRGTVELFLFEEGRGIVPLSDVSALGLTQLSGAVKVGNRWFVGSFASGELFRVFAIEDGRISLLREYALPRSSRLNAKLVRTARGDALGVWVSRARTYVMPIDPVTGQVGAPLVTSAKSWARLPKACGEDEDGWVLKGPLDLSPYIDFSGGAESLRAQQVEVHVLARYDGLCVEALSARSEEAIRWGRSGAPAPRVGVPMTVIDRRAGGQRWAFRCE